MFSGSITALITPFKDGAIDWESFDRFVEWQIEQGSHGLVPCGTTGESPTLSHEDHKAIIRRCVQVVNKRIPVIAGTGSNSTAEAVDLTNDAKEAGADACLMATPYYNKPTQDGLYAHYKYVHDSVGLPIVLYDIPGRSVVEMTMDTVEKLAALPNIVGIKDATNDLARVCAMRERVSSDFAILSGEDATAAALYALGGHGCISVASNVAPALSAAMWNAWARGDIDAFGKARDLLAPLGRDLFCESSPAPVKYAAARMGFGSDEVRLPLLPATEAARKKVDAALRHAGLI
jgi:4-hydroxy-tetrahydrodipicolinate synthase